MSKKSFYHLCQSPWILATKAAFTILHFYTNWFEVNYAMEVMHTSFWKAYETEGSSTRILGYIFLITLIHSSFYEMINCWLFCKELWQSHKSSPWFQYLHIQLTWHLASTSSVLCFKHLVYTNPVTIIKAPCSPPFVEEPTVTVLYLKTPKEMKSKNKKRSLSLHC